jgi:hypothetical protein
MGDWQRRFPEGPFIGHVNLVGGPGVVHMCPHCGGQIQRLDHEARVALLEAAARKAIVDINIFHPENARLDLLEVLDPRAYAREMAAYDERAVPEDS